MAPAGRQGHPKATIGTPKGDIEGCYDDWILLLGRKEVYQLVSFFVDLGSSVRYL